MSESDQLIDSEMKKSVWVNTPTEKIYTDNYIIGGTFLGGPLVAGWLIASNYKVFNKPDLARKTWIYSILITAGLFGSLLLIPNIESIPRYLIPIPMTVIAFYVVRLLQGEDIKEHIEKNGSVYSFGRVFGIVILCSILSILPVFGAAVLFESAENADIQTRKYGVAQNEISFKQNNMTVQEIDVLANALRQTTFFDEATKRMVYVKKADDKIILSIGVVDQRDMPANSFVLFTALRSDLQKFFPENPFVINLFEKNLEHVIRQYN